MPRDQGGDIGRAPAATGAGALIDLSGAVNRRPWPVPDDTGNAPTDRLAEAAARWFGCLPSQVLAVGSPAMRLIPRLLPAGQQVARRGPTEDMAGADLAVVTNPTNPEGREWPPEALAHLARRVGLLVVDESLADARPDLSLAPALPPNAIVLRSLRPLWGLRLGIVLAQHAHLARLSEAPGFRPADARALRLGTLALADRTWAEDAILYHAEAALRLDRLAIRAGWRPVGGTHLFRLYDTGDAAAAQERLARAHVWTRRFPSSSTWLRLGIPGSHAEWDRLSDALRKT